MLRKYMSNLRMSCVSSQGYLFILQTIKIFEYLINLHIQRSSDDINIYLIYMWYIYIWMVDMWYAAAAAAKSLQSCPTLCDPIAGSPPGSPIPGILQARTLEWVAISFSNAWKWKVKVKLFIHVQLFATPWTAAYQAPPPMGFSRQEYWSGLPMPSPICGVVCSNFQVDFT